MRRYIEDILKKNLEIEFLEITNKSHLHKSHISYKEGDYIEDNTHFKIEIYAKEFYKMKILDIHKMVNNILKDMHKKIHSIEIKIHKSK